MDHGPLPPELLVSCMCNVALILTYFGSLLLHFLSDCVQGLSQVEEMLLCSDAHHVCVLPQGQYGYSGQVINLPQDMATQLDTSKAAILYRMECCHLGPDCWLVKERLLVRM